MISTSIRLINMPALYLTIYIHECIQSTESTRVFLVNKLKEAEVALKAIIGEIGTLKKQALVDQEVTPLSTTIIMLLLHYSYIIDTLYGHME